MTTGPSQVAALPLWQGRPQIAPLSGGLSNASFKVTDDSGCYAVRFGPDYPVHDVSRRREIATARAAHAAGFAPEIVYDGPGVMVSRFIEGRVFEAADMRANIGRVAALVRAFHLEMPRRVIGPPHRFEIFDILAHYGATLADSANPLVARLPDLLDATTLLAAALPPQQTVFAHHDLLPANLIDDGKRLWLIDFEYSALGNALFDLGGVSSNAGFSPSECESLLAHYFDGKVSDDIRRGHAALACASLLREALWALVSELYLSAPGADYNAYARLSLERFDAAFADFRDRFAAGSAVRQAARA